MAEGFRNIKGAFKAIGIPFEHEAESRVQGLLNGEHSSRGICIAMWEEKDNLIKAKEEGNFWPAFMDAVTKWSWPSYDGRWTQYFKDKEITKREKRAFELLGRSIASNTRKRTECVYFIQGESGGPIKIGYSADIGERFINLQIQYHKKLKILLVIPGTRNKERSLHQELQEYRLQGEWFEPAPPVLEKIRELEKAN